MEFLVKVNNLTVDLISTKGKKLKVLKNIDFQVKEGEFVTLLGPSGCGKTTLIKTIAGLIAPSKGTIDIPGDTILKMQKRGLIGYVPQHSALLPYRTVEDNVALPLEIQETNCKKEVSNLLSLLGLKRFARYYPRQLSGGMQKKVAVARALISKPKLVLMDEPFSSLDELTREKLNSELVTWQQRLNTTVLFVTHSIEEAVFLSNRIILLSQRPARILKEVTVDLPKERRPLIRSGEGFLKITKKIRSVTKGY